MPEEKLDIRKPEPEVPKPTPEIKKIVEIEEVTPEVEESKELPTAEAETPLVSQAPAPASQAPVPSPSKDPILTQIENVLSEDLDKVYNGLPTELKPAFKAKGEEVARTIRTMVETAKVKVRKVLKLIIAWLKIIPGANKFFLEQEAAVKAQKIMTIVEAEKKK